MIEELETDFRTFMRKVSILSATNPELYEKFIEIHPYKPREITGISIRNIVIEYLNGDVQFLSDLAKKHNIGVRTLNRKVNKLKTSKNQEERKLYDLYKAVAYNHKHGKENSIELEQAIKNLEPDLEEEYDDKEKRRQELLAIEKEYEELSMTMPREEAAKKMGYTNNRIWKLLNELYRIEIELNFRENNSDKRNEFIEELKVKQTGEQVEPLNLQTSDKEQEIGIHENDREEK